VLAGPLADMEFVAGDPAMIQEQALRSAVSV
jgi:hypothetical protein